MTRIEIGDAVSQSFRFLAPAWRRAWGILSLAVWVAALLQAVEALRPGLMILVPLGFVVDVFASAAATAALYRLVLEQDHPGDPAFQAHPYGLQWGALEWRVLGANLLLMLLFVVLAAVLVIIWGIGVGIVAARHADLLQALQSVDPDTRAAAFREIALGPGGIVSLVVLVPGVCALIYLGARFALFSLTAADTGGFDPGKSWSLSKGAVLAIIVAALAIYVAQFVVGGAVGWLAGALAGAFGQALETGKFWAGVAGVVARAALGVPTFAGLQLYVYRTRQAAAAVQAVA